MDILTDFNNIGKFIPANLISKTINKTNNIIKSEEIFYIPFLKKKITQQSLHEIFENKIITKIISGPAKESIIKVSFFAEKSKTKMVVDADINFGLKYRIFTPLVQKFNNRLAKGFFNQLRRIILLTENQSWNDSIIDDGNAVVMSCKKYPKIIFYGWEHNVISDIFYDEEYTWLPVKDKVILDIGANIADSAIYFVIKGAKKVIGVEPNPHNYQNAKKNIIVNNFSEKIQIELAACTNKNGIMKISTNPGYSSYKIKNVVDGIEIPILSLCDLIKKYNIDNAVLKIDCEGCEYDVITTDKNLRKFSHIILEYHNGSRKLKKILEKSNFKISIKPSTKSQKAGIIQATRQ